MVTIPRRIIFKPTEIANYQSSNGRYMQSQYYIRFDGDFNGTRRVVSSITISSQNLSAYLNTDANPSTPYTPLYPGSPTTKQYVDQHDTIVSATTPSNPTEGMLRYDSTNDVLKSYNGSAWVEVGNESADINTKTFYVQDKNDLTTAQAVLDWHLAGKNPLIVYIPERSATANSGVYYFTGVQNSNTLRFVSVDEWNLGVGYSRPGNILYNRSLGITFSGTTATGYDPNTTRIEKIGYLSTISQNDQFIPTQQYHPATKRYVDDKVTTSATAPLSPTEGMLRYDTTNDVLKTYDGTQWNEVGSNAADINTKTFYLSDTEGATALAEAQDAVDWLVAGKNPIVKFVGYSYICSAFDNHSSLFLVCTDYNATIENNSVTKIKAESLTFTLDSNNQVTAISTGDDRVARCLSTDINYSTPYTPLYDGSPATKKYVDDNITSINSQSGALSLDIRGSGGIEVTDYSSGGNFEYGIGEKDFTFLESNIISNGVGGIIDNYTLKRPSKLELTTIYSHDYSTPYGTVLDITSVDTNNKRIIAEGVLKNTDTSGIYVGKDFLFVYEITYDNSENVVNTYQREYHIFNPGGTWSPGNVLTYTGNGAYGWSAPTGDESNTKSFYISNTSDLTNAQAAYDRYSSGKNAIVVYNSISYILASVTSGSLYFISTYGTTSTSGNAYTQSGNKYIRFIYSSNTVTSISTGNMYSTVSYLATNVNYSTPYTPQYNGSPTTKKYVDDRDVYIGSSAPTSNLVEGRVRYDTTNDQLKVYDGTQWNVTGKEYTAGEGIEIINGYDYSAMRGPCPKGFHVPGYWDWLNIVNYGITIQAWADSSTSRDTIREYLKIPAPGYRIYTNGGVLAPGSHGEYRCNNALSNTLARTVDFTNSRPIYGGSAEIANGCLIRAIKDVPVVPDNSWDAIWQSPEATGMDSAGIYHNATLGLISISGDGITRITIADKNVGATTVWNRGDTVSSSNTGGFFQRGNNYMFPISGTLSKTSSTQVNASNYGPGNYYSSDTFIIGSQNWSSVQNDNLRGATTGTVTLTNAITNTGVLSVNGQTGDVTISGGIAVDSASPIQLTKIWAGTQAQYDALGSYDSTCVYLTI